LKFLLDNKKIKRVTKLKILGITIDENLNFNEQTINVRKKCNATLSNLNTIKGLFDQKSKTMFFNAFVNSSLNYSSLVWMGSNKSNSAAINRTMKRAARFIYNKDYYDSVTEKMYAELKWLNSDTKIKFETLKMKMWLELPEEIKGIQSFAIFKNSVYQYLLKEQYSIFKTQQSVNLNDSIFSNHNE
jgi:hypothetical protein